MTSDITETAGSGVDALLAGELERVANELAAKHTTIAFVVPVKELTAAVFRALADVPRIPNYDPELAEERAWRSSTRFSLTELHPDPDEFRVTLPDDDDSVVRVTLSTLGENPDERVIDLDLAEAEGFFLAGLAAVAYRRQRRQ
jgi:hypothetical protein